MNDQLLGTIDTIYDCIGDNFDYDRALGAYSKIADESGVFITEIKPLLGKVLSVNIFNMDPAAIPYWMSREVQFCPVRRKLFLAFLVLPHCVPVMRRSIISDESWNNSLTYKKTCKPWGLHDDGGSLIIKNVFSTTFCAFLRHPGQRELGVDALGALAVLNKHLHRAMTVQKRVNKLEQLLIQSCNMLDLIEFGLVLFNSKNTPVFVNAAAKRIFDANDGLSIGSHALVIGNKRAEDKFNNILQGSFAKDQPVSKQTGGIVKVQRMSRRKPYSLLMTPMRFHNTESGNVSYAVYIFDPEQQRTSAIDLFTSSYDLSPSEAELALCLAQGDSLEDAAAKRGVSRNTAKTQLHSIFSKTETNRQAELLSLMLRSVAGIKLS